MESSTETDIFDTRINLNEIPISALRPRSRDLLSVYLDPIKILQSEDGLSRDWRGIFYLSGLGNHFSTYLYSLRQHATIKLLDIWHKEAERLVTKTTSEQLQENSVKKATFEQLQHFLSIIDRLDCLDDMNEYFIEDAKEYLKNKAKRDRLIASQSEPRERNTFSINDDQNIITVDDRRLAREGLPLQQYDAFVLFANEDMEFATETINELEKRNLKLCVKERDLLSGHSFEHDAIRQLLTKRCNRVIVVLSPAFVLSPLNEFIANLAQSLAIVQRKRKLIPCLYKPCEVPEIFRHMHLLNYERSQHLYNYWDKLSMSVESTPEERIVPSITICDVDSATAVPKATNKHLQPPSMTSGSLTTSYRLLSKQHSISSVSLKIVPGRTTDSYAGDDEFVKQPKIFPPEQRRRGSTSMLNIKASSSLASLTGEVENYNDNNIPNISDANGNRNSIRSAGGYDTVNDGTASVDGSASVDGRPPKKKKWYKKVLFSPQNGFKISSREVGDLPKLKEKRKWGFRKKINTSM